MGEEGTGMWSGVVEVGVRVGTNDNFPYPDEVRLGQSFKLSYS